MKCEIIFIGRTTEKYLQEGIELYLKRLKHYFPVNIVVLPSAAAGTPAKMQEEEGIRINNLLKPRDFIILLDERGEQLSSVEFAKNMDKWMVQGFARFVFITGGAFGVSPLISERADFRLSASRFTFTHQMIRLILVEQLYRAFTILRNESYHH